MTLIAMYASNVIAATTKYEQIIMTDERRYFAFGKMVSLFSISFSSLIHFHEFSGFARNPPMKWNERRNNSRFEANVAYLARNSIFIGEIIIVIAIMLTVISHTKPKESVAHSQRNDECDCRLIWTEIQKKTFLEMHFHHSLRLTVVVG